MQMTGTLEYMREWRDAFRTIAADVAREPLFNITMRKVGGIRFIRCGRLSLSFCIARER